MLGLALSLVLGLAGVCIKQHCTIRRLRKKNRQVESRLTGLGHTLWFLNSGLLAYLPQSATVIKARERVAEALTKASWSK